MVEGNTREFDPKIYDVTLPEYEAEIHAAQGRAAGPTELDRLHREYESARERVYRQRQADRKADSDALKAAQEE